MRPDLTEFVEVFLFAEGTHPLIFTPFDTLRIRHIFLVLLNLLVLESKAQFLRFEAQLKFNCFQNSEKRSDSSSL